MQQYSQGSAVSLSKLQQALGIPLIEVWLGLLLSNQQYKWEQQGEFYRDAKNLYINHQLFKHKIIASII